MSSCTDERNAQILIQVLKAHGIKKVIASPGTTNACLVSSMQSDPFFEIYSAPEERSGAYMACGMAAESGEPVVLSCTGATASRNYMPALTEAFYRKLPILTVTSSRRNAYIGHNCDQVTDRTVLPNDVAKISVQMPIVLDGVSEWNCTINANKAVLELYHRGGGPAHINLETTYSKKKVTDIQPVRIIRRFMKYDELPNITTQRVCIFVGAHVEMDDKLERAISEFCKKYNGIVLCDHTSNYRGEYRAFCNIVANQYYWKSTIQNVELMVHIGDISSSDYKIQAKEVWRVNPDGEIRDTFQKLYNVFEMKEVEFFEYYNKKKKDYSNNELLLAYRQEEKEILSRMPELPFSNIWIASVTAKKLPADSVLHLGIRNSLRSWNYFDTQETVTGYSNTGGFGIDGSLSTVIGAALCHPDRLYYCVLGDLAFFYDMNALGNRHVPSNIRTDEYALAKARQENILLTTNKKNWTIIRPYKTYNNNRLQLGMYEKEEWLYRLMMGKTLVFPNELKKRKTTLTYAADVAVAISELIENESAYGEIFHITTTESLSWEDAFEKYTSILSETTGKQFHIKYVDDIEMFYNIWNPYQIKYDCNIDRRFDNSKINRATNNKLQYTLVAEGINKCLKKFIESPEWRNINWKLNFWMDNITGEKTKIWDADGLKEKARYVKYCIKK